MTFSVSSKELVDLRFSRKFCGEVNIDVRSNVKSWVEQNSRIAAYLWALYNNPRTKSLVFDPYNVYKIKRLLMDYNYSQSLLVIESLAKLQTRIVQQNIPYGIKKLQCIFFESFAINILAVYSISRPFVASSLGADGKLFKTIDNKTSEFQRKRLKGVKFKKFSKIYTIKKVVFSENVSRDRICKCFKSELTKEALQFCFKLLQRCNLKTLRKNYKGWSIRRVWVPSKAAAECRFFDIYSLRDQVLQQVLGWGIRPVSESQADSLSFGFRPQRSAVQAIAYVYEKLSRGKVVGKKVGFKLVKVGKHKFVSFPGKKVKFKSLKFFKNQNESQNNVFLYDYWVYLEKEISYCGLFKFYEDYCCLDVDVAKCFDKISHKIFYSNIPVVSKYLHLVKCCVTKITVGLKAQECNNFTFKGLILGPIVCNIVLDGLQDFIQNNYRKSRQKVLESTKHNI